MSDMSDKTALVTGASRGIGQAVARRLGARGALVAVHYATNEEGAAETVAAVREAGGNAFAVRAEFGTGARPLEAEIGELLTEVSRGLDGRTLDVLVNNAGTWVGSFEEVTPEEFARVFLVNVTAPFFLIQRALPLMSDGGRIVNISTASTRIALAGEAPYAMTKGAVERMGFALANELGKRGITINTVAPGPTPTGNNHHWLGDPRSAARIAGATALNRLGHPEDIADVISFLTSDEARWLTANLIDASGGIWLGPKL
ncbi:short-chain dehydrogenase [Spongiactinospora rosea]|uniref:Short-chain dehydrogenase n=1 Tax=Spongiactinospora rosea TaxID=2248750 RepID=A0A366LXY2_9ACTN|nr:SDR family oxidoreductase [Spongiactinospora rosea]RBQ18219.1 short-chain dehydrogenase [Spongiactinospora rosea]